MYGCPIKCNKCGRFIADKDIPNCEQEDRWDYVHYELIDVYYYCLKCTEKRKNESSSDK